MLVLQGWGGESCSLCVLWGRNTVQWHSLPRIIRDNPSYIVSSHQQYLISRDNTSSFRRPSDLTKTTGYQDANDLPLYKPSTSYIIGSRYLLLSRGVSRSIPMKLWHTNGWIIIQYSLHRPYHKKPEPSAGRRRPGLFDSMICKIVSHALLG